MNGVVNGDMNGLDDDRNQPVPPPLCLRKPLTVPTMHLFGPGPTNPCDRVLQAGTLNVLGHMQPDWYKVIDEIKEGIQYIFQTRNKVTLAMSGSGHAAMETAICNLVEPGDVVLVCKNGLWGERIQSMADRHDADVRLLEKPLGSAFSMQEIEQGLEKHKPAIMYVTHGESSSGVCQPLEGVGALCHRYNCLLIVDSVAALGAVPMYMDKWEIDILYTGSQKALGSPSGSAPISFSNAAMEKVKKRKTKIRSFYFDINLLSNYWGCNEGQARVYHHTPFSNALYNLRESLAMVAEETLEKSWERHQAASRLLCDGLQKMGMKLFVKDESIRLPCVTSIELIPGVDWRAVTRYAMQKHRIEIGGGLGPSLGQIWRIGLLGANATPDRVKQALTVFEDSINHVKNQQ